MDPEAIQVLLVEDRLEDAELMRIAVARTDKSFRVCHVSRLAAALERLAAPPIDAAPVDVVLADLSLPDSTGLETVARLRAAAPNIPIVVLTGLDSDEVALRLLDEGAQDYLVKGTVTGESICRSIRYARQRQQNAEMRRLLGEVQASKQLLAKKNRRLARLYKTAHRFVNNVSHEFRTPLTVIKEYAALIREGVVGPVNDQQGEMLDILGDRADDLNTMVDDMLDMSKLEAGMLCTSRRNVRIAEILEHIRPNLERKALVKNVALEIRYDPALPEVYCDPEKVGRVIVNLCVNAIKFCGQPGAVRLWADVDPAAPDVIVGITDNGMGLAPDELSIIFKRFAQLKPNPRGSTKGFGLGLNIAKELVDLHFGRMRVESRPGAGSTFSFTIPQADPVHVLRRYLERIDARGESPSRIALITARLDPAVDPVVAADVDSLLNWVLRRHDLIFRRDAHSWLVVLLAPEQDLERFLARVAENREETNRNRPSGKLPEIALETHSVWPLHGRSEEILVQVQELLGPLEACHV